MTPEEFENLRRGDKVILNDSGRRRYNDKDIILEVAGKSDVFVLCYTEPEWGQEINGWVITYDLPNDDKGKWAEEYNYRYLDIYEEKSKRVSRGTGCSCHLCKNHNLWGENNYPENNPTMHICFSCRTTKGYLLSKL